MQTQTESKVPFSEGDFIPLPAKSFGYRGVIFTRSTLLRLREANRVKFAKFRFTGKTKPRLYVLRESLDAFIAAQMESDV
jgi:hypothetical protein